MPRFGVRQTAAHPPCTAAASRLHRSRAYLRQRANTGRVLCRELRVHHRRAFAHGARKLVPALVNVLRRSEVQPPFAAASLARCRQAARAANSASSSNKKPAPQRQAAYALRNPVPVRASAARPYASVARRPSTLIVGPPIIQSTWIRLSFAPSFASSSFAHSLAVNQAGGVGLSQRDVAGGVLVEQRVVEQHTRLRDRRPVCGTRCHLTQAAARPHPRRDQLVQRFFARTSPWRFTILPPRQTYSWMFSISVP